MLCTRCKEIIKPIVAIDIDGTLGDYHSHLINFACSWLGIESKSKMWKYDGAEHFRIWFCKTFEVDVTTFRLIKLAYRQGGMKRSMPLFDYAPELVAGVREAGAEVWLTTTRPYLRLDNVDPDTRHWLALYGIEYDGILYDEDKYKVLADLVDPERVVSVLDDLPEQYDAAAAAFGEDIPLLRKTVFNSGVTRPWWVENLPIASSIMKESIKYWRTHHDAHN